MMARKDLCLECDALYGCLYEEEISPTSPSYAPTSPSYDPSEPKPDCPACPFKTPIGANYYDLCFTCKDRLIHADNICPSCELVTPPAKGKCKVCTSASRERIACSA